MKKIILSLLFVISASGIYAQQPNKQRMTPEQRIEMQMKRLDKNLELTDDQETKIKALYEAFYKERVAKEERKTKMDELNQKIMEVLTDEQKEAFKKMLEAPKTRKRK